jgi:hypothetical protein
LRRVARYRATSHRTRAGQVTEPNVGIDDQLPIVAGALVLRPLVLDDAPALYQLQQDPEVQHGLGKEVPPSSASVASAARARSELPKRVQLRRLSSAAASIRSPTVLSMLRQYSKAR